MNPRRLIAATLVALAILAAYNFAIARQARKTQRQAAIDRARSVPADAQIVFLGHSLMEAGCDLKAFTTGWPGTTAKPVAVNLALGETSPVEHALLLKEALSRPIHPKYLVYGFADHQLTDDWSGAWSDLMGNRALAYQYPADAARLYAPGSWLKPVELGFTREVPMFAERSSLWKRVEKFRWKLEEIGMPHHALNRFGRVEGFGSVTADEAKAFTAHCREIVAQNRGFSRALAALVQMTHEHGIKLVLVEMPMPARHRDLLYGTPEWKAERAHLQSLAQSAGATYIAASDWVTDDGQFADAIHLNAQGAGLFSTKLAAALSAQEQNGLLAATH